MSRQGQGKGLNQPKGPAQGVAQRPQPRKEAMIRELTDQATLQIGHQGNASPDQCPPHQPADQRAFMQVRMNHIGPLPEGCSQCKHDEFDIGEDFAFLGTGFSPLIAAHRRNTTDIKIRKIASQRIGAKNIGPAAGLDRFQDTEHPYMAAPIREERCWRDVKNFQTRIIRLLRPECSAQVQSARILTQSDGAFRSSQAPLQ